MGKRTKAKSSEEIRSKIRRLEKELCRRTPRDSYENEELDADGDYELDELQQQDDYPPYEDEGSTSEQEADRQLETVVQVPVQANPQPAIAAVPANLEGPSVNVEENPIPVEILAILGEATTSEEVFGKNIPTEVSERWGKILVEGLPKEQREALLAKILIPENFQLVKAPKLNAEVTLLLTELTKNRDKRSEKLQNQLGSGIAGIANLTAELITKDFSKLDIITKLSEISQVLLDLHHEETMNRRLQVIPLLDKGFLNVIQGVKRNKFIFGDNLTENIKLQNQLRNLVYRLKSQTL